MIRILMSCIAACLMFSLSACGGGDGGSGSQMPSSVDLGSKVVKGVIHNGVVTLSRWEEGQYMPVATAMTNDQGGFNVTVPDLVAGEVLRVDLSLSTDAEHPTEMLCDAAVCGTKTFGEWVPLTVSPGLASWVTIAADGSAQIMPVTPVSTLLVAYAESVGGGRMTSASVSLAKQRIASLFVLDPQEMLAIPGDVTNPLYLQNASPESLKVSLVSAAFAQISMTTDQLPLIMNSFSSEFNRNNGRLLQAGQTISLGGIFNAIQQVLNAAGNPTLSASVSDWLQQVSTNLQVGQLNPLCVSTMTCAEIESQSFLTALSTVSPKFAADMSSIIAEQGYGDLLAMIQARTAKENSFESAAYFTVKEIWMEAVFATLQASIGGVPVSAYGLTYTLDSATGILHVEGEHNGAVVNLDMTTSNLLEDLQTDKTFSFAAKGAIESDEVKLTVDGTVNIDATETDFSALIAAYMGGGENMYNELFAAAANILRHGDFVVTIGGQLEVANKISAGRHAVAGNIVVNMDMDGGTGGRAVVAIAVVNGSLTLPTGEVFSVNPVSGQNLVITMVDDLVVQGNVSAVLFGHASTINLSGTIKNYGLATSAGLKLLAGSLDGTVTQADIDEVEALSGTEVSSFQATIDVPDMNRSYQANYNYGELVVGVVGEHAGLVFTSGTMGLMVRGGEAWWMVSSDAVTGASVIEDNHGGVFQAVI